MGVRFSFAGGFGALYHLRSRLLHVGRYKKVESLLDHASVMRVVGFDEQVTIV